jgi:hypothetical protein
MISCIIFCSFNILTLVECECECEYECEYLAGFGKGKSAGTSWLVKIDGQAHTAGCSLDKDEGDAEDEQV